MLTINDARALAADIQVAALNLADMRVAYTSVITTSDGQKMVASEVTEMVTAWRKATGDAVAKFDAVFGGTDYAMVRPLRRAVAVGTKRGDATLMDVITAASRKFGEYDGELVWLRPWDANGSDTTEGRAAYNLIGLAVRTKGVGAKTAKAAVAESDDWTAFLAWASGIVDPVEEEEESDSDGQNEDESGKTEGATVEKALAALERFPNSYGKTAPDFDDVDREVMAQHLRTIAETFGLLPTV